MPPSSLTIHISHTNNKPSTAPFYTQTPTPNPHAVITTQSMDSDRPPPPHRTASTSSSTTTTTSDLFICFTSRHHSSSMKISSKSILSPGRTNRDPPFSLTTSLSRRLRTNRSIKGGASPALFPTTTTAAKKRGGGFENQEPSSPKVTCIGQVRIKSKKKQGKRLRSLSRRHSIGDVSFRKLERSRDGFSKSNYHPGSSSFGSNQDHVPPEHRNNNNNNNNQRWVHLPLTICEALRAFGSEFSCLFPCRSSCFSPATERVKVEGDHRQSSGSCAGVCTRWLVDFNDGDDGDNVDRRRDVELVVEDENVGEEDGSIRASRRHVFDDLEIVNDRIIGSIDEARVSICIPPKNALLLMRCRSDPLKMEALANRLWQSTVGQNSQSDEQDDDFIDDIEEEIQCDLKEFVTNQETHMKQSIEEDQNIVENNDENEEEMTYFGSLFDEILDQEVEDEDFEDEDKVMVTGFEERSETAEEGLPECLLLMMYEPKLSMEVSKETWVSSKDFIRRQPSRKKPPPPPPPQPVKPTDLQSKVGTTITTTIPSASKHATAAAGKTVGATVLPGRSSCSLPAPSSMAEMLEQKLVNAVGYEPFVLTRCKSEPMRTAAAKLAPDNCFWKNRKLEPLRRASFGVGAAGVGF